MINGTVIVDDIEGNFHVEDSSGEIVCHGHTMVSKSKPGNITLIFHGNPSFKTLRVPFDWLQTLGEFKL